jgi:two-component system response regulator GlrR
MCDVLLIDDDGELLHSLARALSPRIAPLSIGGASSVDVALALFRRHRPRVVVVDLCLDEKQGTESGFQVLSQMRDLDGTSRIIVVTGHGSLVHGVRALQLGAASFVEKPADPERLAAIIIDAAAHADLRREFDRTSHEHVAAPTLQLVGRSDVIKALRDRISFIATIPHPVLILGETGTGKGLCARIIHACSSRRARRFVHAQPNFGGGDLAQSELFGHLKGAFTGATESRVGLASEAHEGTLFLDELDEFSHEIQVRLLDLIQERRSRPVGSDSFKNVDCRFIAAMNRPLDEALAGNKVRRDLYHRVAHNVLHLPALRERSEDIPDLCDSTLASMRARGEVGVFEVQSVVLDHFKGYRWPGNIRELQAVVENAAYHAHYRGRTFVSPEDIVTASIAPFDGSRPSFHQRTERFKLQIVEEALAQCEGSQVRAARMLGLDRGTLRRIVARSNASQ